MASYIPPHLQNKSVDEKRVRFDEEVQFARKPRVFATSRHEKSSMVATYWENENARLRGEVQRLQSAMERLKEHASTLTKSVELYKGKYGECISKSLFDSVVEELETYKKRSYEYGRKLKNINEEHEKDTASLRTEINILREELKKSEKQISHLMSNIKSLSEDNTRLKEELEHATLESVHELEGAHEEENKELIRDDWENIKTSLVYLLGNKHLVKQFSRESRIDVASLRLTLQIVEKVLAKF